MSALDLAALRAALAITETNAAPSRQTAPSRAQLEAAEKRGYERGLVEGKGQRLQEAIALMTAFLDELKAGNAPAPLPTAPSLPLAPVRLTHLRPEEPQLLGTRHLAGAAEFLFR